jgi:hypothetical protein
MGRTREVLADPPGQSKTFQKALTAIQERGRLRGECRGERISPDSLREANTTFSED